MEYELTCLYCNSPIGDPEQYFEDAMADEMVEIECDYCEKTFLGSFMIRYEIEKLSVYNGIMNTLKMVANKKRKAGY